MGRKIGVKAETTYTFSVTFKAPPGANIPDTRAAIKKGLISSEFLGLTDDADIKVHLTNKEVSYGKR